MDVRSQILNRLRTMPSNGTEDAALRLLALRHSEVDPTSLINQQLTSGAWSAFPGVGIPNAYHTSLTLLALRPYQHPSVKGGVDRGFEWLSALRGRESHWLWRLKFRLFDRQVRFDPIKSGWPWVPETVSWVAPTALAMLAFQAWRRQSSRVVAGAEMLLDRACPQGGWNAGNGVAFGVELDPHPDFTAMAALALRGTLHSREAAIHRSLEYLARRLSGSISPYSLAWAVLALSAYDHERADCLRVQLETCVLSRLADQQDRVLAVAALALEQPTFTFREVAA